MYPVIDGHFWVERDGKVIDPYFEEYDKIKKFWGCVGDAVYQPADDLTQQVILRKFEKILTVKQTGISMKTMGGLKRAYDCWGNASLEIVENGGTIVFGSMGWKKKKTGTIHYEFGGDGWKVHQFLK
jgi:hypothetical protein